MHRCMIIYVCIRIYSHVAQVGWYTHAHVECQHIFCGIFIHTCNFFWYLRIFSRLFLALVSVYIEQTIFCKRDLYQRLYSAKETYCFKEPTNRSHTISEYIQQNFLRWYPYIFSRLYFVVSTYIHTIYICRIYSHVFFCTLSRLFFLVVSVYIEQTTFCGIYIYIHTTIYICSLRRIYTHIHFCVY